MLSLLLSALIFKSGVEAAASSQTYSWANVHTGASGGFTPGIVFHPKQKGLAYARTDIGGVYRLNSDDSWTPLTDAVGTNSNWDLWGSDCLAVDPSDATRVYVAAGMYTNSWDPNNGAILSSTDQGASWTVNRLSFKVGGNMPGRGLGERLAVDPHNGAILFYGARSGHGLWKSTNYGATWTQVTTFPTVGTYIPDPSDTSGYNSDIIGFSWVTFDPTSGSSGSATPRIFAGVATNTTNNIFVTTDGGTSWSAVAGQNHTFIPHKGVIDTSEGLLYISYSNGAGPYDGTLGFVKKYAIASGTWTDITPVSGSDLYFGFGGLAVDAQKPGTVMVAALNSWWPEASIYRSLDSGTTWSKLWDWQSYPTMNYYFSWSAGSAPWLGVPLGNQDTSREELGWMIEALAIDPFDSNHWLYGTGETIYGSHDLLTWDTKHNVSIISLSNGMEETSVQDLTAPPSGPILVGAMGDVGGFVWTSLTTAPTTNWNALTATPLWSTASGVDYAGNNPSIMVRLGGDSADTVLQVALSNTGGQSWYQYYGASTGKYGGKIAISADGVGLLWVDSSASVTWSTNTAAFAASSGVPGGAVIASDKRNNTVFYAASGSNVYLSTNYGSSFTAVGTLQGAGTPVKIAVNPFTAGDLFVSTDVGVFHSTNYGKTFTALSGFGQSWAIAVGAPKTSGGTPSLYVSGTYSSVVGIFRTDDYTTVYQIDNAHGFGSLSANPIAADPNVYGRVFVGTNGRGTFYGTISGGSGTTTTTKTSTTSTKSATTTTTTTQVTTTTTTKTTTTTTKSTTTTTTTTTASGSCATLYGQCGGAAGYTGATCCASGSCVVQNPYYSQCIPS